MSSLRALFEIIAGNLTTKISFRYWENTKRNMFKKFTIFTTLLQENDDGVVEDNNLIVFATMQAYVTLSGLLLQFASCSN